MAKAPGCSATLLPIAPLRCGDRAGQHKGVEMGGRRDVGGGGRTRQETERGDPEMHMFYQGRAVRLDLLRTRTPPAPMDAAHAPIALSAPAAVATDCPGRATSPVPSKRRQRRRPWRAARGSCFPLQRGRRAGPTGEWRCGRHCCGEVKKCLRIRQAVARGDGDGTTREVGEGGREGRFALPRTNKTSCSSKRSQDHLWKYQQ